MADSAKIVPSAFAQLANVVEEKPRLQNVNNKELIRTPLAKYSETEFLSIMKNLYVGDKLYPNPNLLNAEGLISYFLPIHEEIGQVLLDTEKMKKLAPEIDQARLIRVSSTMSPNDLQEGKFIFDIDQIPGLTEDARKAIIKVIGDYFNDVEKFGKKANAWIGDCLYGAGSTPILILPVSIQKAMRKDGMHVVGQISYNDKHEVVGNSSINLLDKKSLYHNKQTMIDEIADKQIYTLHAGNEDWTLAYTNPEKDKKKKNPLSKLVASVISDIPDFNIKKDSENFRKGLEELTINFVKKIEEGDIIKLTENPEIIRFATEYRKKSKQVVNDTIDRHFSPYMAYDPQDLLSLNKYENTDEQDEGHPLLLELPAESVIPICTPSNEKEHLGYFVLLDEAGEPLKVDEHNLARTYGWGGGPQASFQAMFGGMERNIFASPNFKNYEEMTVRKIFNNLLDQYLKSKLKNIGLDDVSIDKTNAITTTMLYRLFEHKRTRILFVPCSLMTYICFDYRADGTGKSLLEKIHYLLSLRITFQVAALMGMAKDAINHRTLNVTFDEKDTNPEALMNQITNMFVEKERMPFTLDPTEISRGIARNAISIAPKNMRGLTDFAIERVNDGGGGGNKPDTELLDTLTNMLVTALGVPYSALNQLAEQEYAKSITTTNLFFSKQIKSDQEVLCAFVESMCKTYIKYSPKLKEKILLILKDYLKDINKVEADENKRDPDRGTKPETTPSTDLNKDVVKQEYLILRMIMDNLNVKLPTPNIAQDKAQYAEITEYINTLSSYLDIVFSNELMPMDNQDAVTALTVIKAHIKSNAVSEFMNKIGTVNTMEIPSLEEFQSKIDVGDIAQQLLNFAKGLKNTLAKLSGQPDMMNGMGGGMDMMGGMNDGMGMEEDMNMNEGGLPNPMDMNDTGTDFMPQEIPTTPTEEQINEEGNFTSGAGNTTT